MEQDDVDEQFKKSSTWRLVSILEALAQANGRLGVREASRATGIDKTAVNRILSQLQTMGLVEQDVRSGQYRVGPRLFALAASLVNRDDIGEAARPILNALSERFNETTYLAVRRAESFTYQARVDCAREIRHVIDIGYVGSLHAGAAGRAILAGLAVGELEDALDRLTLTRLTTNTITSRKELVAAVEADRALGYSFTQGERISGATAIAAPFFDATDECVGSLVITRPTERHSADDLAALADAVKEAALLLTERLGGRR